MILESKHETDHILYQLSKYEILEYYRYIIRQEKRFFEHALRNKHFEQDQRVFNNILKNNRVMTKGICIDNSTGSTIISSYEFTPLFAGDEINTITISPYERRCVYIDPWGILRTYPCPVIKPKPAE